MNNQEASAFIATADGASPRIDVSCTYSCFRDHGSRLVRDSASNRAIRGGLGKGAVAQQRHHEQRETIAYGGDSHSVRSHEIPPLNLPTLRTREHVSMTLRGGMEGRP